MNKAFRRAAIAVALVAAPIGCHPAAPEAPLAGARIGGPFVLTDQDGHRFDSRVLAGRYPVVYFGYTSCPDICPTDMAALGQGLRAFERVDSARAAKVVPLFITVDPARDTPAVLKSFVAAFHPRLVGLTGREAQIAAVARAYVAPYHRLPAAPGVTGYAMQHSSNAILFGPGGEPVALLPVDSSGAAVAAELERWVR